MALNREQPIKKTVKYERKISKKELKDYFGIPDNAKSASISVSGPPNSFLNLDDYVKGDYVISWEIVEQDVK